MMVLAVGARTEWGRLLALTGGETDSTPLQEKLTGVAALVAKVGLSVAVACFVVLFIFLCVEVCPPTAARINNRLHFNYSL
jgi:Ca2+-transporting ATPase